MEVEKVIIRKPVTATDKAIAMKLLMEFQSEKSYIAELCEKLTSVSASYVDYIEGLLVYEHYTRVAELFGFKDCSALSDFINIYGIESLF